MNMKEKIPELGITYEEFLAAYHAATPEIRREIRRVLGLEA